VVGAGGGATGAAAGGGGGGVVVGVDVVVAGGDVVVVVSGLRSCAPLAALRNWVATVAPGLVCEWIVGVDRWKVATWAATTAQLAMSRTGTSPAARRRAGGEGMGDGSWVGVV
jgi:hypothetical protein